MHFLIVGALSYPTMRSNVYVLFLAATNFSVQKNLSHGEWGEDHLVTPDGGRKFGYLRGWPSEYSGGWLNAKVRYWKIRFMLLCHWAGAGCLLDREGGMWSGPQEKGSQPPRSKLPCLPSKKWFWHQLSETGRNDFF